MSDQAAANPIDSTLTRMSTPPRKLLTEAEMYSTLPLGGGMIRVLDVRANPDPMNIVISGRLHIVSLVENPVFVALSYCWGSVAKHEYTHEIRIETDHGVAMLKMAGTAHVALSDIRNHLGHMTIWIDAICIDQSNIFERETQVPLMKAIFTQAATVYVHLGASTQESNTALDWLSDISRRRVRGVGILNHKAWSETDRSACSETKGVGSTGKSHFEPNLFRGSID